MNCYTRRIAYLQMLCAVAKLSPLETIVTPIHFRRQAFGPPNLDDHEDGPPPVPFNRGTPEGPMADLDGSDPPPLDLSNVKGTGAQAEQRRFTTRSTTMKRFARTTPLRISFEENCDYIAFYCLKAYTTGQVCGRTLYYVYHTFKNYCLLDYVNCMERYEVWQVVHMGECYNVTELTEYLLYPYDDDYFLDQYYVLEDH